MSGRRIQLAEGFEHVRELVKGEDRGGAQNAGVHVVRRIRDGTLCIKKTIWNDGFPEDPEFWTAIFQQEIDVIQALRKSRIPHINRYIHHEEAELRGGIDLYTKLCDLGSLDNVMKRYFSRGLNIPEEFIWHVFESMSRALAYLHFGCNSMTGQEAQPDWDYIVHGDIKPENIFLNTHPGHKYPIAILGDFGCSTSRDQFRYMQRHNNIGLLSTGGTRPFYAPERVTDIDIRRGMTVSLRGLGPHGDIWALGVSLMLMMGVWRLSLDAPGGGAVQTQAHVDLVDQAPYTPQLRRTVKSTLCMEARDRQQAKTLVRLIRQEFRDAIQQNGLRNLLNVPELPSWAVPISDDVVRARRLSTPNAGNSQPAASGRSQSGRPPSASNRQAHRGDGPNSVRRQAVEAAMRRANDERQRDSAVHGHSAPAPTPASNRSQMSHGRGSVRTPAGARWPQPRADAVVLPRLFVQ